MTRPPGKHNAQYIRAEQMAEEIFKRLQSGESLTKIGKEINVSSDTIRRAVKPIVGPNRWESVVRRGMREGFTLNRFIADKKAAKKLEALRTDGLFWECSACGWDTREPEWQFPPEQVPDQCPKCYSFGFEERRPPLATAFHQDK